MKLNLEDKPDFIGMAWGVIDAFIEGTEELKHVCTAHGMKMATFFRTVDKHKDLKDALALARRVRAQMYADEALSLSRPVQDQDGKPLDWGVDNFGRYTANGGLIQRDSLRIKTLLQLAARYDPEQFGDRVITDVRDEGQAKLVIGDSKAAAELIAKARQQRLEKPNAAKEATGSVTDITPPEKESK